MGTEHTKVVVNFVARHSGARWDEVSAMERPRAAIVSWLRESAGVDEPLVVQNPIRAPGKSIGSVVWLRKADRNKVLRRSGDGNAFSRPFQEKGEDPMEEEFGFVPLPFEQDLASSRRTAACYEADCFGVVPFGKGYALRVRKERREAILQTIHGEQAAQKFSGTKYEIRSIPSYWGKAEIRAFLKDWGAEPLCQKGWGLSQASG